MESFLAGLQGNKEEAQKVNPEKVLSFFLYERLNECNEREMTIT